MASILGINSTVLIYNGSAHGWKTKDFHSRCDDKGPTISLFKIKDDDCIGGYASISWESEYKIVNDSNAMLFNLNK